MIPSTDTAEGRRYIGGGGGGRKWKGKLGQLRHLRKSLVQFSDADSSLAARVCVYEYVRFCMCMCVHRYICAWLYIIHIKDMCIVYGIASLLRNVRAQLICFNTWKYAVLSFSIRYMGTYAICRHRSHFSTRNRRRTCSARSFLLRSRIYSVIFQHTLWKKGQTDDVGDPQDRFKNIKKDWWSL